MENDESRQILVASPFSLLSQEGHVESELPCPRESGSSAASVSPVLANGLSLLGFASVLLSASMLWDSSIRQLPSHLPLGRRAFIAQDEFDRNAGRWSLI